MTLMLKIQTVSVPQVIHSWFCTVWCLGCFWPNNWTVLQVLSNCLTMTCNYQEMFVKTAPVSHPSHLAVTVTLMQQTPTPAVVLVTSVSSADVCLLVVSVMRLLMILMASVLLVTSARIVNVRNLCLLDVNVIQNLIIRIICVQETLGKYFIFYVNLTISIQTFKISAIRSNCTVARRSVKSILLFFCYIR